MTMGKWAKENQAVFALLALLCTGFAWVFLSKSEAAATYALKTDIIRVEVKIDRLLIACGKECQ